VPYVRAYGSEMYGGVSWEGVVQEMWKWGPRDEGLYEGAEVRDVLQERRCKFWARYALAGLPDSQNGD
jgi:hypothetical protein